jgi:hypothetical protein
MNPVAGEMPATRARAPTESASVLLRGTIVERGLLTTGTADHHWLAPRALQETVAQAVPRENLLASVEGDAAI